MSEYFSLEGRTPKKLTELQIAKMPGQMRAFEGARSLLQPGMTIVSALAAWREQCPEHAEDADRAGRSLALTLAPFDSEIEFWDSEGFKPTGDQAHEWRVQWLVYWVMCMAQDLLHNTPEA